jgi:hypothetical protein
LGARLGIKCQFNEHGEGQDLPPALSIHLYRIVESALAHIEAAPKAGILVEFRKKKSGAEVAIVAKPLPVLPPEAAARLQAFNGRLSTANGILTISLPL